MVYDITLYIRLLHGLPENSPYNLYMEECILARIFAENVSFFRKRKGFSQYDLANRTGISRSMISHYEIEGMLPPIDKLQILAGALDIPVPKLFEDNSARLPANDLSGIDPRSVKKLQDILSLPAQDRNDLYRILNNMLRKNQLEKQSLASNL
jgi:transcriptional regulator with XRE-family HTH domain